jgi:hypothetical protein
MSAPRVTSSLLPAQVVALARKVVEQNAVLGRKVAVAESCTGGLVAAAITEIAGSSAVLDRGFVTYSNEAKQECLGVCRRHHRRVRRGLGRLRVRHGPRRARAQPRRCGGGDQRRGRPAAAAKASLVGTSRCSPCGRSVQP